MTRWCGLAAFAWLATAAPVLLAQEPTIEPAALEARVRDAAQEPLSRCAALVRLHDQGALDIAVLTDALSAECEPLRAIAARIARHTILDWPPQLRLAVAHSKLCAVAVLGELALAPRPSLDALVAERCESGSGLERVLALAARTAPLSRQEADFVVRELAATEDRAALLVVQRLEPAMADQLVTTVHGHLQSGVPLARVLPVFERLSPKGVRQLLSLSLTLESEVADGIVDFLSRRHDPEFEARLVSSLDRNEVLPPSWVRRCGPWLVTDERRARAAAILRVAIANQADAGAQVLAVAAFEALLEAAVYVPEMVDFARVGGADRWRRLFDRPLRGMPDAVIDEQLTQDKAFYGEALRALSCLVQQRRQLSPHLDARVIQLAQSLRARVSGEDAVYDTALRVLAQSGDAAVEMALELAASESRRLVAVCEHLAHRKDPVGASKLRLLLQRTPSDGLEPDRELRRMILLLLAERGERAPADEVVAVAGTLAASLARRARLAWPLLDEAGWRALLVQLDVATEDETRIELLLWLSLCPLPEASAALVRVRRSAAILEVREAAFEALMRGPQRAALVAEQQASPAVDAAAEEAFSYAAMSSLHSPLTDEDASLLQWLLFTAPRRDDRERLRAEQFGDGRAGFPLVAGIAAHLRRHPQRAIAICGHARELAATNDTSGLLRQRFLFLWTALQADPHLRVAVGCATAGLVLAIEDRANAGVGPASYYLAQDLAAQQRHAEAATAARSAFSHLLLDAEAAVDVRIHLGVRDPFMGIDAHAALAAAPFLYAAHEAQQRGDAAAARQRLLDARELAGRDAATLTSIESLWKTLR